MNLLQNLKIAVKLAIAFVGLVAITLAMSFVLWSSMNNIKEADKEATFAQTLRTEYRAYKSAFSERRQGLLFYLLTGDRDGLKQYNRFNPVAEKHYTAMMKMTSTHPEITPLVTELDRHYRDWVKLYATEQVSLMRNYLTVNQARAIEAAGLPEKTIESFELQSQKLEKELNGILATAETWKDESNQWFIYTILASIGMLTSAAIFFGVALTRAIATPVGRMTVRMTDLAEGNLDINIRGTNRRDEIGDMARAVQVFKDNAILQKQMQEQEAKQQELDRQRAAKMEELAQAFDSQMASGLAIVTEAVSNVSNSASTMEYNATRTGELSQAASAAIEETNANIQTVSSATTQLSASIHEISRQMTQTSEVSRAAVEEVDRTTERVKALNEAADSIGQVVQIISDIAEQTNLLALNATIESARAGDAGKGFAVVANEVKTLASQTGRATEEISTKIQEIQSETSAAAEAVIGIGSTIRKIDELTAAIVSAIEEQGAATSEIARNVEEAAQGTNEVSSVVQTVADAADETGKLANSQIGAVTELDQSNATIKSDINTFLDGIKKL